MVQLCAIAVPLLLPAGMTVAPLGGDERPCPRMAALRHTRTGGAGGPAAAERGGSREEEEGGSGVTVEGCSDGSASQARPATPAVTQPASAQAIAPRCGRPEAPARCASRIGLAAPLPAGRPAPGLAAQCRAHTGLLP